MMSEGGGGRREGEVYRERMNAKLQNMIVQTTNTH